MHALANRSASLPFLPILPVQPLHEPLPLLLPHRQEPPREQLHEVVRHAQLRLVRLPLPQIRRRRRLQNAFRHAQRPSYRENLAFVQVGDELNVHNAVARLAEVAQIAVFVLVARAHHHARSTRLAEQLGHVVAHGGALGVRTEMKKMPCRSGAGRRRNRSRRCLLLCRRGFSRNGERRREGRENRRRKSGPRRWYPRLALFHIPLLGCMPRQSCEWAEKCRGCAGWENPPCPWHASSVPELLPNQHHRKQKLYQWGVNRCIHCCF